MAATKAKKPAAKKAPAKKPAAKKTVAKRPATKRPTSRAASTSRFTLTRSEENTQVTWVLICIWLILIAIFLGTVIGKWG